MNKNRKSFLQKITRFLLLALLISGGSVFLPQKAISDEVDGMQLPPGQIQKWKDYLKNYPQMLTDYYKKQKERRKTARKIVFSKNLSMHDALKAYPFLQEDFQKIEDMQNAIANSPPPPDATVSVDNTVNVRIAQDLNPTGNLLFVEKTGTLVCGTRGCESAIYMDQGGGYKKLTEILFLDTGLYVSRSEGKTYLYLTPPSENGKMVEWIVKGNKMVINVPPPPEPQSQAFVLWRHEMTLKGQDPEAHMQQGDDQESHGNEKAPAPQTPRPDDTLAPPEE